MFKFGSANGEFSRMAEIALGGRYAVRESYDNVNLTKSYTNSLSKTCLTFEIRSLAIENDVLNSLGGGKLNSPPSYTGFPSRALSKCLRKTLLGPKLLGRHCMP